MRDTDSDWTQIAKEHPYWGVLSDDQFRGVELPAEKRTQFFATGEKLIHDVIAFAKLHIDPNFKVERALDFGCGVGRLLIPLGQVASHVVGVDIAPDMLAIAARNLATAGVANARLVISDDELSQVQGTFNFINSYIVHQHLPPQRGLRILERMFALLEVDGVFSIQLTYAKERRFMHHEQGGARYYRRDGNAITDLLPTSDRVQPGTVTMFDYDLSAVMLLATRISGVPLLVLPTDHDGHMGVHLIGQKVRHDPG